MAGEKDDSGEWQALPIREETLPPAAGIAEEEAGSFPIEWIEEPREDYTAEEREKLGQKIMAMAASEKFRLAILGNREARNILIHDPNRIVSVAVLRNQKLNETEVLQYVQRKNLSQEIISAVAKDQKWRKSYPVRFALASNPKTPVTISTQLLPHLLEKDLKVLSRGKDALPAVSRAAEILLKKRK